ncbi:MAG: hypothetical protein F4029_13500 [Gammaproteobacteria bacterium]|nr:hypothetical protein [Gammaproteobacteria bacterium]
MQWLSDRNRWLPAAMLATGALGAHAAPAEPTNLDFEDGSLGQVPTGWFAPPINERNGYTIELSDEGAKSGRHVVLMSKVGAAASEADAMRGGGLGNVMQVADATPYRGKRVRFSGWVRTEMLPLGLQAGRAQAWFRVDRPGGHMGFFDNMQDRPIRARDWQRFEIIGDIAPDAETINFGLMLIGNGKAWLDGVAIDIAGVAGEGNQPPGELGERGLENLFALARLLGYVRYFHPTDAVAETDWNLFAVQAVRRVEEAATPRELAQILQSVFQDVAPTVRVAPTGDVLARPAAFTAEGPTEIRYWEHNGVKVGDQPSIYSSNLRTSATAPLSPDEPIEADLGGGVSALVPTAIPVDQQASFEGTPDEALSAGVVPDHWRPTGDDRSTRLAAVVLAWNVFQHFYPYFDVVDVDWETTLRRSLKAAAVDAGEVDFIDTIKRLVADLRDGHGRVAHQGEGPRLLPPLACDWVADDLVVTAVGEGIKELRPGDVVTEIDGGPVLEILASFEETISSATAQHLRHRALADLGLGPPGSTIALKVRAPSGKERTVAVERNTPPWGDGIVTEPRPDQGAELAAGVVYVDLGRIQHVREFNDLVPTLANAKGIVFDMRGYPAFPFTPVIAHLIDETVTSAQWHVPLVNHPDRRDMQFRFSNWPVNPKSPRFTQNIAVVTDGRAISAAETFLGIIEHYKLAEIVGGPTAGTNGNINPFMLPGGYHVTWTGMRVLKHDGSQHHGVGIQPTVPVSRTVEGITAGRDELLERAVAVLTGG